MFTEELFIQEEECRIVCHTKALPDGNGTIPLYYIVETVNKSY